MVPITHQRITPRCYQAHCSSLAALAQAVKEAATQSASGSSSGESQQLTLYLRPRCIHSCRGGRQLCCWGIVASLPIAAPDQPHLPRLPTTLISAWFVACEEPFHRASVHRRLAAQAEIEQMRCALASYFRARGCAVVCSIGPVGPSVRETVYRHPIPGATLYRWLAASDAVGVCADGSCEYAQSMHCASQGSAAGTCMRRRGYGGYDTD